MSRLLIVANRLPITVSSESGRLDVQRSAGGLATGLARPHEQSGGLWIGWPGLAADELTPDQNRELHQRLAELRLVPVSIAGDELRSYYEGYANGVLWPLFHYFVDQIPLRVDDFATYESINARFADCVAAHYRSGDTIWVHDYQLLLVPGMLRERLPDARIGFFLHIPFPSEEIFRTLAGRERILEGLLGADLIGFHTAAYQRHFSTSLLHIRGITTTVDRVQYRGREVRLGSFPMGIDAEAFTALAEREDVVAEVKAIRGESGLRLLVGIDRLDYTKGIPRRLLAYERLLQLYPELCERVRLVQVAVPSRLGVEAYQEFREHVDGLIGRIHGAYATPHWVPVQYIVRNLSEAEVVALYRAADVALVTPLRDGMNLVAKEFAASRVDDDGVLVLSEFAGAAAEMAEAIFVNPYDVDATAHAIRGALGMERDERRWRMEALRRRVLHFDVHQWVRAFIERLEKAGAPATDHDSARLPVLGPGELEALRSAGHLVLLLDYDGSLVPIQPSPELARPDPELLELLRTLTGRTGTEVHIVSGRKRETLEEWLGGLPVGLHAEHGFWSRLEGGDWVPALYDRGEWRGPVRRVLEDVTSRTPGSLIEEKTAGFAWHYRKTDREYGRQQANELRLHLMQMLSNQPVEVIGGHKVIEVRLHGIHKGLVPPNLLVPDRNSTVLAIGDDQTDEDLFASLPGDAYTVRVGDGITRARYRIAGVPEVRALLRSILEREPSAVG